MPAVIDTPEVVEHEEHALYEKAAPGTCRSSRILAQGAAVCETA